MEETKLFSDQLAIVASGCSLIGAGLGPKINQYPLVLRFNGAPVRGFEKDVGKYFTHWSTNFIQLAYPSVKGFDIQEIFCTDRRTHRNIRMDFKTLPVQPVFIPPDILKEILDKYSPSFYKPSSGLRLLWWIYKITGKRISRERIFGMDCFGYKSASETFSTEEVVMGKDYHSIRKHAQPSPRHRPIVERKIFNEITT